MEFLGLSWRHSLRICHVTRTAAGVQVIVESGVGNGGSTRAACAWAHAMPGRLALRSTLNAKLGGFTGSFHQSLFRQFPRTPQPLFISKIPIVQKAVAVGLGGLVSFWFKPLFGPLLVFRPQSVKSSVASGSELIPWVSQPPYLPRPVNPSSELTPPPPLAQR